jgi:hypothetical protein
MAIIEGGTSGILADVDGVNSKALNVVVKPRDVSGAYRAGGQSGIIPAATASGLLFNMRNGPTTNSKRCYITRVSLTCQVVTAPTAAAGGFAFELVRTSVANTSGGTALTIFNKKAYNTSAASAVTNGGAEGGDIRIATTSVLTVTGVTIDTVSCPTLMVNCTTTTPAIGSRYEYTIENDGGLEHMIELAPGEGLAVRHTATTPTAFTFVLGVQVAWHEK